MTAPTLLDYAESPFSGTTSPETTDDLNWSGSGDLIVALGITEDNGVTLTTSPPTVTGITLSALSGLPTNTADSCKGYGWSGTASGDGNSTVSSAISGTSSAGIAAWAFSAHGGLGGLSVPTPAASAVASLTVQGPDSTVVMILGDWNATADVTADTTPAGGTIREIVQNSDRATFAVVEWTGQAAGTRNYGLTNWTGTSTITRAAVEIKGTSSGTNVNAETASFTFSAQDSTTTVAPSIEAAAFTLGAQNAAVVVTNVANAQSATFTFAAQDFTTTAAPNIQAATFTLSAQDATIARAGNPAAEAAAFTLAAQDATTTVAPNIGCADFTLSAQDATVSVSESRSPAAEAAEFTIAAQNATVSTSGAANAQAEASSFTLSAHDVQADVRPNAGVAGFTLGADDATVSRSESASAEAASFALAAYDISANAGPNIEAAAFTLTAQNATVITGSFEIADAEAAEFAIAAHDATASIIAASEAAAFSFLAQDATVSTEAENEIFAQAATFAFGADDATVAIGAGIQCASFTMFALNATVQGFIEAYDVTAAGPSYGPVFANNEYPPPGTIVVVASAPEVTP